MEQNLLGYPAVSQILLIVFYILSFQKIRTFLQRNNMVVITLRIIYGTWPSSHRQNYSSLPSSFLLKFHYNSFFLSFTPNNFSVPVCCCFFCQKQKPAASMKPEYQDTEDPEYEDFRAEASLQRTRQLESFNKAAEAFKQGRREVASFYAQQVRSQHVFFPVLQQH